MKTKFSLCILSLWAFSSLALASDPIPLNTHLTKSKLENSFETKDLKITCKEIQNEILELKKKRQRLTIGLRVAKRRIELDKVGGQRVNPALVKEIEKLNLKIEGKLDQLAQLKQDLMESTTKKQAEDLTLHEEIDSQKPTAQSSSR